MEEGQRRQQEPLQERRKPGAERRQARHFRGVVPGAHDPDIHPLAVDQIGDPHRRRDGGDPAIDADLARPVAGPEENEGEDEAGGGDRDVAGGAVQDREGERRCRRFPPDGVKRELKDLPQEIAHENGPEIAPHEAEPVAGRGPCRPLPMPAAFHQRRRPKRATSSSNLRRWSTASPLRIASSTQCAA